MTGLLEINRGLWKRLLPPQRRLKTPPPPPPPPPTPPPPLRSPPMFLVLSKPALLLHACTVTGNRHSSRMGHQPRWHCHSGLARATGSQYARVCRFASTCFYPMGCGDELGRHCRWQGSQTIITMYQGITDETILQLETTGSGTSTQMQARMKERFVCTCKSWSGKSPVGCCSSRPGQSK